MLSEPSIEFVKGMQLYGDSIQVNYDELLSKDNPIDELWTSKVGLDSNQLTEEKSIYAVYDYDPSDIYKESLSFTYSLCINKKGNKVIISDHLYLMFQVDLSLISLFDVYDFIDEQWIPKSNYILSEQADFEKHYLKDNRRMVNIYIAIEEEHG